MRRREHPSRLAVTMDCELEGQGGVVLLVLSFDLIRLFMLEALNPNNNIYQSISQAFKPSSVAGCVMNEYYAIRCFRISADTITALNIKDLFADNIIETLEEFSTAPLHRFCLA